MGTRTSQRADSVRSSRSLHPRGRLATAGVVALTAGAVALAGTPANAAQPSGATAGETVQPSGTTAFAASGTSTTKAVTATVKVSAGYITKQQGTARAAIVASGGTLAGASADLYVGGKRRATITFPYQDGPITWPRSAGTGTGQLRNIVVRYYNPDNTIGSAAVPNSNTFLIRRTIHPKAYVKGVRKGSSIKFTGTKWYAIQANGTFKSLPGRVIVQRKVGSSWKTVKAVKVSRKGSFSFRYKVKGSKRVTYRAIVKTSKTILGAQTRGFKL